MTGIAEALFTTPEMSAVFSGRSLVQRMLDFEAALAEAGAEAGVIPAGAAAAIAAACHVERFDTERLFRDAALSATPAVPLVAMLTAAVDRDARGFVHWGATSQDAVDTALVLQMRDGLGLLIEGLTRVAGACATLADRHRRDLMPGRTLLQHAVPITFGLKAARWLAMAARLIRRLTGLRAQLPVQFGGAAGTLAALGDQGLAVMDVLARRLALAVPDLPWHAERDRIGEVASTLGVVAGSMGKVATDLALLAQTEIGEVATTLDPAGGRSSTMPHKRNPVAPTLAVAAARLAIGQVSVVLSALTQEHERAAGGWQAEWEAVPQLFLYTAGAVEGVGKALEGLEVDPARMRANLSLTDGLIMAEALTMALAARLGREEAYRLVQRLSEQVRTSGAGLDEVAKSDEQVRRSLPADEIERVFDPARYQGSADAFIDRALEEFRALTRQAAS